MRHFIFSILIATTTHAKDEFAHHPEPTRPTFLSEASYSTFKRSIPLPPLAGSAQQLADEKEILDLQKTRTARQCEEAKNEVLVSLESFYGPPQGPLDKKEVQKLNSLIAQVRNDADFFIRKLKMDFPRPRPFLYMKGAEPCILKESSGAYPSGHAALGWLYALILSDRYPQMRGELEKRADEIAFHRVLSGVHHRSDIEAGKALGHAFFEAFKNSQKFRNELNKYERSQK